MKTVSRESHIAAYVLLQLAALAIVFWWGIVLSFVLVIAAINIGAVPYFSFASVRDFGIATLLILAILGSMLLGAELLMQHHHWRAAQLYLSAFPCAIGVIGVRRELRASSSHANDLTRRCS